MADPAQIDQHVELLHAYHLDLWAEVEAQLHVLRAAQSEIEKLRLARVKGEPHGTALFAATVLSRHVQKLKGRVHTLNTTIAELEGSVDELVKVLTGPG
jgi:hypothetical protein